MCRLFGFRSVISSQVHSSLTIAENALLRQSDRHPDGWGVVHYLANVPHVIKSVKSAVDDNLFKRVSGIVASETVLAHLRKATLGPMTTINTHPFQHGRWIFAHNGNIKNFSKHKETLLNRISPALRRFVIGDTDSEIIFYLLLTHLSQYCRIHESSTLQNLFDAIKGSLKELCEIVGPVLDDETGNPSATYFTFIITNGDLMAGHQGGKDLYCSTYKKKCHERESCPSYAPQCEAPPKNGLINHLIFSSEPLQGENIWHKMSCGQVYGVDQSMRLLISEANFPIEQSY